MKAAQDLAVRSHDPDAVGPCGVEIAVAIDFHTVWTAHSGGFPAAWELDEDLASGQGTVCRDMKLSRSRLFAVALEEFIQRQDSRELLARINEAYGEKAAPEERKYLKKMRQRHRKMVDRQW